MINHSVRFHPYDRSGAYLKKIWAETNMMYHYRRLVFLSLLLTFGYAAFFIGQGSASADSWQKVTFDMSRLDENGLYGPPNGKRALSYEFCIPNTKKHKAEVKRIDSTIQFIPISPGRIGCDRHEYLCIGSTHQKDFKLVLQNLVGLEYVKLINECFFE
jgi:hypothetical protein